MVVIIYPLLLQCIFVIITTIITLLYNINLIYTIKKRLPTVFVASITTKFYYKMYHKSLLEKAQQTITVKITTKNTTIIY